MATPKEVFGSAVKYDADWDFSVNNRGALETAEGNKNMQQILARVVATELSESVRGKIGAERLTDLGIMLRDRIDSMDRVEQINRLVLEDVDEQVDTVRIELTVYTPVGEISENVILP